MHVGLVSLGDHLPNPKTGERVSQYERFRQLVDLGVLAEELGFWSFHLGEHHFSDYILSSPTPILAAVAERTERVRLSTAVTLLPHHDAVRIAEDYGTVDLLSNGRVELVAGRGVYRTHYALFGQDVADGGAMLSESVELLKRLWSEERVEWQGRFRAPLPGVTLQPRPVQRPHPPIWVSASSEESAQRAVALGCPIVIATVSVGVEGAARIAHAYRRAWKASGRDPSDGRVGVHIHCYVGAGSTAEAVEYFAPHQRSYLQWVLKDVVGSTAPLPPPMDELATPLAQAVCGSAEDVAAEIVRRLRAMGGADLLTVQSDQGGMPPGEVRASYERFARDVMPRVERALEMEPVASA